MKKILLLAVVFISLLSSCSKSKTFKKSDDTTFTTQPYGWGDADEFKIEGVKYKANMPDIVLSCLFCETVLFPVLITAFDIMEPMSYEDPGIENK